MHATLYLFACALATTQAPVALGDSALQPRLTHGQELLYRGTYTEEARGQGVLFSRVVKLETRAFVLDVLPQASAVAFLTVTKVKTSGAEKPGEGDAGAVRLEITNIDPRGHIKPVANTSLLVPLDGPPTVECGVFIEAPKGVLQPEQTWEVADGDRPPRTWTAAGVDVVGGVRCVKIVGTQQSDDWDKPRADRTAWRRQDTMWMTPKTGYAAKVERIIERREPARKEANLRSVLRYELESALQYPNQLYEDRRRDILQTHALTEYINTLLPRAGQIGAQPFDAILKRIEYHNQASPPTPYRDALRRVQHLAEMGKRGEAPAETKTGETTTAVNVVGLDKPAPDFLVGDLVNGNNVRLRHWFGRPILLVFYDPTAGSAPDVLHFAQKVLEGNSEQVVVLGLPVSDDTTHILKQRAALRLTFPLLSGTGLRKSYAVEATPKLVVLDANGVVRGSWIGWGPEIPHSITEELKKCRAPGQP